MNDAIERKIGDFLRAQLKRDDIGAEEELFVSGFVSSLLAMQLVTLLETSFGITIEDEDLDLDNFSSIRRMGDFVRRKREPVPA